MKKPPRRLLLAISLVDRAQLGELSRLESNSLLDDDGDGIFPRNMSLLRIEARVGGARTYASILPVHSGLELPENDVRELLKSSLVNTIANNSNLIGPRGPLPQ